MLKGLAGVEAAIGRAAAGGVCNANRASNHMSRSNHPSPTRASHMESATFLSHLLSLLHYEVFLDPCWSSDTPRTKAASFSPSLSLSLFTFLSPSPSHSLSHSFRCFRVYSCLISTLRSLSNRQTEKAVLTPSSTDSLGYVPFLGHCCSSGTQNKASSSVWRDSPRRVSPSFFPSSTAILSATLLSLVLAAP